jgi:hypothetical protein
MHTLIVLAIGFGLLAVCLLAGRAIGDAAGLSMGALIFMPLWLVGAGINLYLGVKTAGYSVREELPIFFLVFAVPVVVASLVWWKAR